MEYHKGDELKEFLLGMILGMNEKTGENIYDACVFVDGWVEPDSTVDFCSCRVDRGFYSLCHDCRCLTDENDTKQLMRAGWLSRILYVYDSIDNAQMKPRISVRRTAKGECVIVLTK